MHVNHDWKTAPDRTYDSAGSGQLPGRALHGYNKWQANLSKPEHEQDLSSTDGPHDRERFDDVGRVATSGEH